MLTQKFEIIGDIQNDFEVLRIVFGCRYSFASLIHESIFSLWFI